MRMFHWTSTVPFIQSQPSVGYRWNLAATSSRPKTANLAQEDYLFPSRIHDSPYLGTRQYARNLEGWIAEIRLDPAAYGTHTMQT